MTNSDRDTRQLIAVAASLLDQGRAIDRLSRPLTVASAIGPVLLAAVMGRPPAMLVAILALAALAGLVELILAIRVGFDAALFRQLATSPGAVDFMAFDAALLRLALVPEAKIGRPPSDRIAGARRLLQRQATILVIQVSLLLVAGALAALG